MSDWTFQSLIDANMQVTAYCRNCIHYKVIDLVGLRDKYGGDVNAMNGRLAPRLVCTKCGTNKPELRYTPDSSKVPGMGNAAANAYAKAKGER
ncbi:hypothetical protein [Mesorhizobium sp. M0715]|uniref:hypothetical protein n=1 Tax=Mesorhizobium sp. M0715 TaxID=2956990 RepID=UPI0033394AC9